MEKATEPGELVERVSELTARLDGLEPEARDTAYALLAALMELYGRGFERIFDALDGAPEVREELVDDGLVASLLMIHGLYPVELETRVREALDRVRPYMESHGGGVELLGLEGDVARLRLEGSCNGCGASASTLELAIVQALEESAPDLLGIEVEGVVDERPPASFSGGLLPLASSSAPAPESNGAAWIPLAGAGGLPQGELAPLVAGTVPIVVANVEGTLLAYRDACAACGAPLREGELAGGVLACPACGREFDLPLAGRAAGGDEPLQLTPVPLLAEDGSVFVALGA
jgi:Fe-S cluster biogenesis protein NfuA/nitrite reductase/ring-hydroxylating ferredoxin subunit